jgi:hypothetical protein
MAPASDGQSALRVARIPARTARFGRLRHPDLTEAPDRPDRERNAASPVIRRSGWVNSILRLLGRTTPVMRVLPPPFRR